MGYFTAALQAENIKIRKSKMIWITLAIFTLAPVMGGFFMFVLKDPELARTSGLLGDKAQIMGEATWPAFFSLLAQIIAVGGLIVFGFVTSWVFGREYADRTIKDLLALPAHRSITVLAKFVAVLLTCLLLSIYVVVVGTGIGMLVGLPEWSSSTVLEGFFLLAATTALTVALSTPVAFFACYGKGFLAPLGFVVFMVVCAQLIAAIGYGAYFPWAVPALYSGMAGISEGLGFFSFFIVALMALGGFAATVGWWLFADQQ
ncbi:ABC transporter permease [Planococcus sp. CAU13]|uniref:ABC transporter permease n=1 Tax=Planococcus sp. CAU13 TaxID=1541197 RepID=UPI00052FF4A4|nr:ABC transporter permease [Planococcus sp. CAU13]